MKAFFDQKGTLSPSKLAAVKRNVSLQVMSGGREARSSSLKGWSSRIQEGRKESKRFQKVIKVLVVPLCPFGIIVTLLVKLLKTVEKIRTDHVIKN